MIEQVKLKDLKPGMLVQFSFMAEPQEVEQVLPPSTYNGMYKYPQYVVRYVGKDWGHNTCDPDELYPVVVDDAYATVFHDEERGLTSCYALVRGVDGVAIMEEAFTDTFARHSIIRGAHIGDKIMHNANGREVGVILGMVTADAYDAVRKGAE